MLGIARRDAAAASAPTPNVSTPHTQHTGTPRFPSVGVYPIRLDKIGLAMGNGLYTLCQVGGHPLVGGHCLLPRCSGAGCTCKQSLKAAYHVLVSRAESS